MEKQTRPLLDWLLQQYPDTPKTRAKQWILAGRVSVGGVVVRKPHAPMADPGDRLELGERHASTLACEGGWRIHPRLRLLHLDSALAVVDKGAGLLSVPGPEPALSALSLLADFLAGKLRPRERGPAGRTLPPVYRKLEPLPVHRLDQYTTGVFCLALNPAAREPLIRQVKDHTMEREYVAFVEGRAGTPRGTWRHWLELDDAGLRQRVLAQAPAGASKAVKAITHFEVLAEYPVAGGKGFVSRLRLRLETGLKHQIRAQAAAVGLPLVGERTYYPNAGRSRLMVFPRQALHAAALTLEHPERPGNRMTFRADFPADLRQLEMALRAGAL